MRQDIPRLCDKLCVINFDNFVHSIHSFSLFNIYIHVSLACSLILINSHAAHYATKGVYVVGGVVWEVRGLLSCA